MNKLFTVVTTTAVALVFLSTACGGVEEESNCSSFNDVTSCESNSCRSVLATRFDFDNSCYHENNFVACVSPCGGTDSVQVIATDLNGDCWAFPDSCIPNQKYTVATESDCPIKERDEAFQQTCTEP
tara:strand:- start:85 stop:465 length:381 start_codon:yes stop_codon:yes gene_type:complete